MKNLYDAITMLNKYDDEGIGGGAASAIAGSMAANIISMVSKLSLGKDYGLSDKEYGEIIEEANRLSIELRIGSIEDDQAYLKIRDAYRLPKKTDDDIRVRKKAIMEAGYHASKVPCDNAVRCARVYELGNRICNKSNPSAITDLICAVNLSKVGITGCVINTRVNYNLIKDEERINELENIVKDL